MTSGSTKQYTHRPVTVDDATLIVEAVNAYSQAHYGDNRLGESEVRTWFGPDGKPERDDVEIWLDAKGEPQAYAQLCDPEWPPTWDVWLDATVHPASSANAGLWDNVLDWAERTTRVLIRPHSPEAGHRCGIRILEMDKDGLRACEARGFQRARTETLMHIGFSDSALLPAEWPEGIRAQVLDFDGQFDRYALAYGEAFRDHWGHVELPPERLIRTKHAEFLGWGDEFIPELWFVAMEGDEIVGGVGSFLNHGGDPTRSYLYNVFVRRAWRNRGIATALLRRSFHAVHERGARSAELHVDSENLTWALQLYRGVGMKPLWHQHLYEKVLPPAEA